MTRHSARRNAAATPALFLLAATAFAAPSAEAALLQIETASINADGAVVAVDAVQYDEFDTSLGTLQSVSVTINGVLTGSATFLPAPITVPTPVVVNVTQDIQQGATGRGFEKGVSVPATFLFNGVTGPGDTFNFASTFSYDFVFNAASDLVGLVSAGFSASASAVPMGLVAGLLDDFEPASPVVAGLFPIETLFLHQLIVIGLPTSATSLSVDGTIIVQYAYEPFDTVIPLPAAAPLFAGALGLAALMRRRRRA